MSGYGITQVDIPAALNAYMTGQDRRTMQMQRLRQEERERQAAETADKTAQAYAKLFAPKATAPQMIGSSLSAAYSTPPTQDAQGSINPTTEQSPVAPVADSQPNTAIDDNYDPMFDPQRRQEFLSTLSTIDGPQALEYRKAFATMDKDRLDQTMHTVGQVAKIQLSLSQIPEAERAAEVQRLMPMLRQLGLDDEMLASPDLSDQGLAAHINQARDIENIYKSLTPQSVAVPNVGLFTAPVQTPFGNANPGAAPGQNLSQPRSIEERNALPDGARYMTPDGSIATKTAKGGGGSNSTDKFPEWR